MSIVGVVVGTVAGEGRRRRRKAEISKFRGVVQYRTTEAQAHNRVTLVPWHSLRHQQLNPTSSICWQ